jgi:hypothetical protein
MADHLERASIGVQAMTDNYYRTNPLPWKAQEKENIDSLLRGEITQYCKEMADDVNAILRHNTD